MPWPHDYRTWTGSLNELVDTANAILREHDPQAPQVTVRTARHYQGEGLLGRGTKHGRSATFGFQDLARLVSAKSLVNDGLPISYTSSVLASAPASDLAQAMSPSGQKAVDVVAQMMSQSVQPSPLLGASAARLMSMAGPVSSTATLAAHSPSAPSPVLLGAVNGGLATPSSHRPVSWLRLDIDEAALARASAQERTTAAHALLHWAARLTAPTPPSGE